MNLQCTVQVQPVRGLAKVISVRDTMNLQCIEQMQLNSHLVEEPQSWAH